MAGEINLPYDLVFSDQLTEDVRPRQEARYMVPDCPNLFVYGTLRSAFQNHFARLLSENATLLGGARVRGRLYRLEGYPALRRSSAANEFVVGELYKLHDPASILPILDGYEGCGPNDPRPCEFDRVLDIAILEGGQSAGAWMYVYNSPVAEERRVLSGDFLMEASSA